MSVTPVYTIEINGDATITGYTGTTGVNLIIPDTYTNLDGIHNVIAIGVGAFASLTDLTGNLTFNTTHLTSIGMNAFYHCTGFTGNLIIPSGVTTIGVSAFSGCYGFTSLSLPSGLTTIGVSAFKSCTFTGITSIPSTVTSILDGAFSGIVPSTTFNLIFNGNMPTFGTNVFSSSTNTTLYYYTTSSGWNNVDNIQGTVARSIITISSTSVPTQASTYNVSNLFTTNSTEAKTSITYTAPSDPPDYILSGSILTLLSDVHLPLSVLITATTTDHYATYNSPLTYPVTSQATVTFVTSNPCFLSPTRILSFTNNVPIYKPISTIKKGDYVQGAVFNCPTKVKHCGYSEVSTDIIAKYNYPRRIPKDFFGENKPFEDIYCTGGHRVITYSTETITNTKELVLIPFSTFPNLTSYTTNDEIMTITKESTPRYYHIELENENEGVIAGGVGVEGLEKGWWERCCFTEN